MSIAAGIDLRKAKKEDNTMQKKMSTFEKVFREEGRAEGREEGRAEGREEGRAEGEAKGRAEGRAEGEAKGTENTIRNFIERKRNRHVSDEQIHEELLLDFGLSAIQARKFMEPGLAKA